MLILVNEIGAVKGRRTRGSKQTGSHRFESILHTSPTSLLIAATARKKGRGSTFINYCKAVQRINHVRWPGLLDLTYVT